MTPSQSVALEQIQDIADVSDNAIEVREVLPPKADDKFLRVNVSVDCSGFERADGGLPLRARELFQLVVSPDFPFRPPSVWVLHNRFSGYPHVPWKRFLCLYQASSVEWLPSDGMFGLFKRLELWLERMARAEFDTFGGPLHPPLAAPSGASFSIIPRVNTPPLGAGYWLGYAGINLISDVCGEISEWSNDLDTFRGRSALVAATFLLREEMPMEYPDTVVDLLTALETRGVSLVDFFIQLYRAIGFNGATDKPLVLIIGTPMRGVAGGERLQHLAAWLVPASVARAMSESIARFYDGSQTNLLDGAAKECFSEWMRKEKVLWCPIHEDRPEIVQSRDGATPMMVFKDKTVAVWGCGALGSYTADFLARAGVKRLVLYDNGVVKPGILCRQLYHHEELCRPKAEALRRHLLKVAPKLSVETHVSDLISGVLSLDDYTGGADIIIDTTASSLVLEKLELKRKQRMARPIPIVSMVIGHNAMRGFSVVAPASYSGGPLDVSRKAKLRVSRSAELSVVADEFFPEEGRGKLFQPEPGCSEPTFVGSAADSATLSGELLSITARQLNVAHPAAHATFVDRAIDARGQGSRAWEFSWPTDTVLVDAHSDVEVRLAPAAWKEIVGWTRRHNRKHGGDKETGGVLLGEFDAAANVLWVSDAVGAPPDSTCLETEFRCGVLGLQEMNTYKAKASRQSVSAIGLWHTHPNGAPYPSAVDLQGMRQVLTMEGKTPRQSLMLIVGRSEPVFSIGAYVFSRRNLTAAVGDFRNAALVRMEAPSNNPSDKGVGLALSGGGARAMAFHLGCLRALHDRGVLPRVEAISAVSGGSVIGAMYAFSHDSFADFDRRVVAALRTGMVRPSLLSRRTPLNLLLCGATNLSSGLIALVTNGLRRMGSFSLGCLAFFGAPTSRARTILAKLQPPLPRWVSRTNFLKDGFDNIFQGKTLRDSRRDNINVVINATELRTGSAFRFGTREAGCWRFGRLASNDIPLAEAVVASACYPAFLPALDRVFSFKKHGGQSEERVLLTDGGVFENLGVSPFEPGRSSSVSTNTYNPEYIVACNAGTGLFEGGTIPFHLGSRMVRCFETVFRKVQDATASRLHQFASQGLIKGFVLPYLGSQDGALPFLPADLVRREKVIDYPTDFSAMPERDIELITERGELITRLLIATHCPEL